MIEFIAISTIAAWAIFLCLLILNKTQKNVTNLKEQPFVSIIIAVRNEAPHIEGLCNSLTSLSYPEDKYEILIGNDASNDETQYLLEVHKPGNAILFNYTESETGQFGKQKVITDLVGKAKGEYLIFTDGDMLLRPNWIQSLLAGCHDKQSLAVGLTAVQSQNLFSKMQYMDWIFNEKVVSWFANIGIGLTAWGNNMVMSRRAYDTAGGMNKQGKSIVEDVSLMKANQEVGGKLRVNESPDAVAFTAPAKSIHTLLYQRKRWMKGIGRSILPVLAAVWIKLFFWPSVTYLSLLNSNWMLVIFLTLLAKAIIHKRLQKLTGTPISFVDLLLFELYDFVFYLITFAFYFIPVSIDWKGRKY